MCHRSQLAPSLTAPAIVHIDWEGQGPTVDLGATVAGLHHGTTNGYNSDGRQKSIETYPCCGRSWHATTKIRLQVGSWDTFLWKKLSEECSPSQHPTPTERHSHDQMSPFPLRASSKFMRISTNQSVGALVVLWASSSGAVTAQQVWTSVSICQHAVSESYSSYSLIIRIHSWDSVIIHQHQPAIFKGYCSPLVSSTTSSHYNKDCHPSPLNSFNLSASRCPSAAQMAAAGPRKGQ